MNKQPVVGVDCSLENGVFFIMLYYLFGYKRKLKNRLTNGKTVLRTNITKIRI